MVWEVTAEVRIIAVAEDLVAASVAEVDSAASVVVDLAVAVLAADGNLIKQRGGYEVQDNDEYKKSNFDSPTGVADGAVCSRNIYTQRQSR
jgi:hypothetical protein